MTTKFEKAAQENADYFGKPYVVFFSSDLKQRVERYNQEYSCHNEPTAKVFWPKITDSSEVKTLGEVPL